MKKLYPLLFVFICLFSVKNFAQSFSDNFDTYVAGSFLTQSNPAWTTWSGSVGGADDIRISNSKAKSGSNSLYFSSGAAGGPNDIVLPFGAQLNTGTMNISMNMFIDNQKKAYFNLQEQTVLGKGWSIDVNFDSVGLFSIVNTTSGVMLSGTYIQNTWIKVELQIDLNSNTWNFLIDGISKGTFQNSYRQIASMDIYPIANSSYYVDDVSYNYTPFTKPNLNAALTYITVNGSLAGQSATPSVEIRNLGTQVINSASIELTYNSVKQTKNISGLNLAYLAVTTINLDNAITLLPNASTVMATVKLINSLADDIATDNTKSLDLNSPIPAPSKVVLAEEATGTWCQWCPRGAVWLNKMDAKYGKLIIGVAVHNNDPMSFNVYDKGMGLKVTGYPSMLVDRGTAKDPSAMEGDFLTRILVAPKATIRNGAKYNSTTRVLDISLTTKFIQAASGNYKVALILIEDSVTGTTIKYAQSNAYAGGGSGVMGGFELLPNPVPANKMVYDHVGRVISPNFLGMPNAFPSTINPGDSFTHNFSVVLDPYWSSNRMHIVGVVYDPTGKVDNASTASINEAITNGYKSGTFVTGITKLEGPGQELLVYPNPSNGNFNILIPEQMKLAEIIKIYTMQGQLIQTNNISGLDNITIEAQSWTPGIYIGLINDNGRISKVKLIKE